GRPQGVPAIAHHRRLRATEFRCAARPPLAAPWRQTAAALRRREARAGRDASLDDLVGAGEERLRHGQAQRLGGLQVDDQLELGRLLYRQVGRLLALEDLPGVSADLAEGGGEARPVAEQATSIDEV